MTYQLIIKGGRILSPGDNVDMIADVAIDDGKIVSIKPELGDDANRVLDVRGLLVTPGLLDLHTHVDFGMRTVGVNARGVNPDLIGVRAGVPTIVDAGTTGPMNFGGFRNYVIEKAQTRVLAFLHAGRGGITMEPDVHYEDDVNVDFFETAVANNRDIIVGVKMRLMGPGLQSLGATIVELAKSAARKVKLPLMVHCGDHYSKFDGAGEVTRAALRLFEKGDIIEHTYTPIPGGHLTDSGDISSELRDAVDRGVLVSVAGGGMHFSYRVAQTMLDAGIMPSFIATDLNSINHRQGCWSFTEVLSQFLALGFPLKDVIELATIKPALAVHKDDVLGRLTEGREADISILDVVEGDWYYDDIEGNQIKGQQAIMPKATIRRGEVISVDWGPHPWGWLPAPIV